MSYARTLRRGATKIEQDPPKAYIERESVYFSPRGAFWGTRYMHPTKGWRYPSIRAAHATAIVAEIKAGLRPWSSHAFADMLKAEGIIRG